MKRTLILTLLTTLALTACGPTTEELLLALNQTQTAMPTATTAPTFTPTPTSTLTPTSTNTPTPLPPTITPTPVIINDGIPALGQNHLAEFEYNGLTIQLLRVVVAEKQYFIDQGQAFDTYAIYDDVDHVGELLFIVENNTDQPINFFPAAGTVVVNATQVDLLKYAIISNIGDRIGEVYPGTRLIGGFWFGIPRIQFDQVTRMIIAIPAPTANDIPLGDDIYLELDLTDHTFHPLPPLD